MHLIPNLDPPHLERFLAAGMNWVPYAADIVVMRDAMNDHLRRLRGMCGDEYTRHGGSEEVAAPCFY